MTKSKRILIITDTYVGFPGGSERHLYNFLSGVTRDFIVDVIQMTPNSKQIMFNGEFKNKDNVNLHCEPLQSAFSVELFQMVMKLRKLIRNNNIELIISYHEKSDILNFLINKLPGVSCVSVTSKRDMGFKLSKNLRSLMSFVTPRFNAVTAPSKSIIDQMVNEFKVNSNKVHIIPNGVDLSTYKITSSEQKKLMRERLKINKDSNVMLCVGSLSPVKGHKYLLQAFSKFSQDVCNRNWKLVLIGEGGLRCELEQEAKKLNIDNNVIFAGFQTNVQDWLSISDLVVCSSLSEGLSNALIEASASGLPIIATDVGGNPEIIDHGYNGLLVKSEDSEALAKAMCDLAVDEDRLNQMSMNARAKAESDFSIDVMVERLQSLYCALLGHRS